MIKYQSNTMKTKTHAKKQTYRLNDKRNREALGKAVGAVVTRSYVSPQEVVAALRKRGLPAYSDV
jgi:hypothetical protein